MDFNNDDKRLLIEINGMRTTKNNYSLEKIMVLYSEDKIGKTMTIGTGDDFFTVPFELIEREIKKARSKK